MTSKVKYAARDIRQLDFKTALVGFDPKAVKTVLNDIAGDYAEMAGERDDLLDQIESLKRAVDHYREIEESIKNAVLSAQMSADETLADARSQSDKIIDEAETRAATIAREAQAKSESTVAAAHKRAASIVTAAEDSAKRTAERADREARELMSRHDGVRQSIKQYRKRFEALLFSQFEALKQDAIAHGELSAGSTGAAARAEADAVGANGATGANGANSPQDGVSGLESAGDPSGKAKNMKVIKGGAAESEGR